jgi:hypothetical protein
MPRFMPPASRPVGPLGYHQLPADVLEEAEMLVEWARRSVTVAVRAQAKAPARRARRSASRKTRGSG